MFLNVLPINANGYSQSSMSMIGDTESMTSRLFATVSRLLD